MTSFDAIVVEATEFRVHENDCAQLVCVFFLITTLLQIERYNYNDESYSPTPV